MHSAQIRANFAQNQPLKRLLAKKRRKSRLMTLKKEGAAHGQRPRPLRRLRASSPKGRALGSTAKFPAQAQRRQALTEGVRL